MSSEKAIQIRDPENKLQVVESWAGMAKDARKRKAAKASQGDDREVLRSLLESYVLTFSRSGIDTSVHTLTAYWQGARRLLDWCAGAGLKPHQLDTEGARRFLASMGDTVPKSRKLYMTGSKAMTAALRWVDLGKIDPFIDEMGNTLKIRDPNPARAKMDPFSNDEVKKLLSVCNERERALVFLGIDGGLRVAEMAAFKWSWIDQERNILKITGKGSKTDKIMATDRLLAAVDALPRNGKFVFGGITRGRLQQLFQRICERAEVKPRGIHNLRHTCGTRMARIAQIHVVQRHLRHASITSTMLYLHVSDEDYSAGVAGLESNGYGETQGD